jgi:hypothetical protein
MSPRRLALSLRVTLVLGLLIPTALTCLAVPATAAVGSFAETELWDMTDTTAPYARYHVQGFAVVHAGTPLPSTGGQQVLASDVVLAMGEGRYTDSDGSEKDLLLRRSTDGGRTWSASTVVVADDPATLNSFAGPSLVVDEQTGAVFLFFRGPSAAGHRGQQRTDGLRGRVRHVGQRRDRGGRLLRAVLRHPSGGHGQRESPFPAGRAADRRL